MTQVMYVIKPKNNIKQTSLLLSLSLILINLFVNSKTDSIIKTTKYLFWAIIVLKILYLNFRCFPQEISDVFQYEMERNISILFFTSFIFIPQVIAAEGEMNASMKLKEAADVMSGNANSLQLRYLQTLTHIAAEKNSTIIFPLPIDMMQGFMKK